LIIQALASSSDVGLRLHTIDNDVGVRDPQLMSVCAAICIASPRSSSSIVRPTAAPSSLSASRSMAFDALMHRPIAHLYCSPNRRSVCAQSWRCRMRALGLCHRTLVIVVIGGRGARRCIRGRDQRLSSAGLKSVLTDALRTRDDDKA
jgi:hypothetical protein